MNQGHFDFDGDAYDPRHDRDRLNTQLGRVFTLMSDGEWRTLSEIQAVVGGSEAGVSARLRDFRKPRHGCHTVERRRRGEAAAGLHEYRLLKSEAVAAQSEGERLIGLS